TEETPRDGEQAQPCVRDRSGRWHRRQDDRRGLACRRERVRCGHGGLRREGRAERSGEELGEPGEDKVVGGWTPAPCAVLKATAHGAGLQPTTLKPNLRTQTDRLH